MRSVHKQTVWILGVQCIYGQLVAISNLWEGFLVDVAGRQRVLVFTCFRSVMPLQP